MLAPVAIRNAGQPTRRDPRGPSSSAYRSPMLRVVTERCVQHPLSDRPALPAERRALAWAWCFRRMSLVIR